MLNTSDEHSRPAAGRNPKRPAARKRRSQQRSERTRLVILDSAERLFSRHGFSRVALRDITGDAGVNVSLVKYYFGSKSDLLREVIERRSRPIIEQRNRLLDDCLARAEAKGGPPDVGKVLEAYIGPVLRAGRDVPGGDHLQRLMGAALIDDSPEIRRTIHRVYRDISARFVEALRLACPGLPAEEFNWRLNCVFGAMIYLFAHPSRVERLLGPDFDSTDMEAALRFTLPFLEAGMARATTR